MDKDAPSVTSDSVLKQNLQNIDLNILDTVGRELTLKNLEKLLIVMNNKLPQKECSKRINEIDQYGYSLIHYFTEIDYHECIKFLVRFGGDVNLKA
jgi:hypothetical protein